MVTPTVTMMVTVYHPVCKCAKHAGHFIWSEMQPLSPAYPLININFCITPDYYQHARHFDYYLGTISLQLLHLQDVCNIEKIKH